MKKYATFIDGDFPVDGVECEHYCSPTCHPAQTGPTWKYGCRHPKHPGYSKYSFVPIVECDGKLNKCEIKK